MPDFCSHVKYHKGRYCLAPRRARRCLVYEKCYKLGFFELSFVFDPADETAVVSRVIAAGKQAADTSTNPLIGQEDDYGTQYIPPPRSGSRSKRSGR